MQSLAAMWELHILLTTSLASIDSLPARLRPSNCYKWTCSTPLERILVAQRRFGHKSFVGVDTERARNEGTQNKHIMSLAFIPPPKIVY